MIFNVCNCPACPCRRDVDHNREICPDCQVGSHVGVPPLLPTNAWRREGPVDTCLAHLRPEPCGVCASFVAAGL